MLNLEVESSEQHVGEPASRHVPRADDLAPDEAQTRVGFDDRHALVVGGEAAPEVDGEDRLLDQDEGHRFQR